MNCQGHGFLMCKTCVKTKSLGKVHFRIVVLGKISENVLDLKRNQSIGTRWSKTRLITGRMKFRNKYFRYIMQRCCPRFQKMEGLEKTEDNASINHPWWYKQDLPQTEKAMTDTPTLLKLCPLCHEESKVIEQQKKPELLHNKGPPNPSYAGMRCWNFVAIFYPQNNT